MGMLLILILYIPFLLALSIPAHINLAAAMYYCNCTILPQTRQGLYMFGTVSMKIINDAGIVKCAAAFAVSAETEMSIALQCPSNCQQGV
jgi:hypothetical protein